MSEPLVLGNQVEKSLAASKEIQEIKLTVDSSFKTWELYFYNSMHDCLVMISNHLIPDNGK